MRTESQRLAEKRYREKHRAERNARSAKWRENNPDKVAASKVAYRSNPENRKKEIAYSREWKKKNPEKNREHAKRDYYKHYERGVEYRRKNAKRRCAKTIEWNRANKERKAKYMREYQRKFPEKFLEAQMQRRAIMKKASPEERREIREWIRGWRSSDEVECHWCHGMFAPCDCHSDHVVALSNDGPHHISNLVIACRSCNITKNNQDIETWIKKLSNEKQA